jgi:hypothetical protein
VRRSGLIGFAPASGERENGLRIATSIFSRMAVREAASEALRDVSTQCETIRLTGPNCGVAERGVAGRRSSLHQPVTLS